MPYTLQPTNGTKTAIVWEFSSGDDSCGVTASGAARESWPRVGSVWLFSGGEGPCRVTGSRVAKGAWPREGSALATAPEGEAAGVGLGPRWYKNSTKTAAIKNAPKAASSQGARSGALWTPATGG